MKGVILAGGLGTRLLPMTRVTNKHLLPVYDRPMIYFPLQQLVAAGIQELKYAYQEGEGGIAEALGLAEHFAAGEPVVVILGDNIFQSPIADAVARFRAEPTGGLILLKEVADPERFGVATVDAGRVTGIVEKPVHPPTRLAVTGCYMYDAEVFDIIRGLEPSARGELEITDVNNHYVERGTMRHELVRGWWTDAGTIPSLHRAIQLVAEDRDNPVLAEPRGWL